VPPRNHRSRPNILVLLTDQHRWDCLGAFGNAQIRTPHLDRLAAHGVRFPYSFCPFPVCTPSRYSLLSGLHVRQHGGWSNRSTLAPGIATFPRLLRAAGYRTKAVGKMHLTPTYLDVGFQEMELAEQNGEGRWDDDYHRDLMAHGLVDVNDLIDQVNEYRRQAPAEYWQTFGAQTSNLPEAWHSTTWIGDRAVRSLERWTDEGHLLLVSFVKPHHPFDPPAPWDRWYDPDELSPLPGWLERVPEGDRAYHEGFFPHERLTEGALRRVMAHYYATISHVDHQIGRMLDTLARRGLYDSTLIVFTADHGEYLGFHHLLLKSGLMYEPLVRTPLLVKFPGNAGAGEVRETLVSNIDLAPTILRQAGVEPPPQMRGLHLADPAADRQYIFAECRRRRDYLVRSRTHKLLLSRDPQHSRFFDLREDPLELANRLEDPACRDLVRQHRQALHDWALFEALPPPYVDERAPQIKQPNIPEPSEARRDAVRAYFRRQMARALAGLEVR
jgi:arylsulfatase A-like enzyme